MKLRRAVWPILGSVVFVGILFAGVFPTRTYLSQRASISRAEKQLEVLGEQNEQLKRRAAELQTDAEIERLAREQHNLVRPGEEAYAVLPAPPAEIDLPAIWPYGELLEPPAPLGSGNAASVPRDE